MRRFFAAGALAALTLGGHSVAVAQTVRGEVVEAGSARPIAGAFVVLVDGDGADCAPVYYLDGIIHPLGSPDRELRSGEIEGIEVHAGSGVPAQFAGSRARCGVIVVWTRER